MADAKIPFMSSTPPVLNRRGMLAVLPVLATVPSLSMPDAGLLRLHADWCRAVAEFERLGCLQDEATTDNEEERLAIIRDGVGHEIDALEDRIAAIPAQSVAGLQVKATLWRFHWGVEREPLEASLYSDLMRGISA